MIDSDWSLTTVGTAIGLADLVDKAWNMIILLTWYFHLMIINNWNKFEPRESSKIKESINERLEVHIGYRETYSALSFDIEICVILNNAPF